MNPRPYFITARGLRPAKQGEYVLFQYGWYMLPVSYCGIFCEKGDVPRSALLGES